MKERGMIFNGEMVRAILDGRKTQTRRQVNASTLDMLDLQKMYPHKKYNIGCPFGAVGDRIWVRETFCPVDDTQYGGEKWVDYRATPKFEASHPAGWDSAPNDAEALKWRPSIHMPRWASRILLEITDVRVERLNAISQEDAQAEGMELAGWRPTYSDPDSGGEVMTPYDNFAELWSSIYGDESWKANPWVWVISFERVEGGAA
ncbi:TPA: morphogenetic protein [Klebsiella pneumoniae]